MLDVICMSFDGEYVTDSHHETIEQAENAIANLGSKWFFYPFSFIVKGKTIKESCEGLVNMATKKAYMPIMFDGKRLNTVVRAFEEANQYVNNNSMEVDCYEFEEILIMQNKPQL